jgi:hypothetical protein
VPPQTFTIEQQVERTYTNFLRAGGSGPQDDVVSKYLYMIALQDRNETLFYRIMTEHFEEVCASLCVCVCVCVCVERWLSICSLAECSTRTWSCWLVHTDV